MQLDQYLSDSEFSPTKIATTLRTSRREISDTLGLGMDALTRKQRLSSPKTQTRLREMLEILLRVEPETGSMLAAYAWFRSYRIPGFGGQTPDQLVRDGHADWVHRYLNQVAAGGYA